MQVTLPFFVLHGEADVVTDPAVSKALYEQASSSDKTICLYPGMWHGLTSGEPDDNIDTVFSDIIAWLDRRCNTDTDADSFPANPVLPSSNSAFIERFATSLPPRAAVTNGKRRQRNGSYLCGLKGRRLFQHPAM